MRLRAFAAGWTVFTMLAAPAMLVADETVPLVPPEQPAAEAPAQEQVQPPQPEPVPPPTEVVERAAEAAQPQPQAAPEPAPTPAVGEAQQEAAAEAAPVARKAADTTVTIKDYEFTPAAVTVNVGDTVTWVNQGPTAHTATGSGFDTGNLDKGESGSHTFNSAGNFSYICTPHPYMKASVTVVASDTGSGSSDSGSGSAGSQDDTSSGTAGTTADTTADGTSLPKSGADAWALALLGTGFLSLGFALRRRSA